VSRPFLSPVQLGILRYLRVSLLLKAGAVLALLLYLRALGVI
jgi:hypothetical protein